MKRSAESRVSRTRAREAELLRRRRRRIVGKLVTAAIYAGGLSAASLSRSSRVAANVLSPGSSMRWTPCVSSCRRVAGPSTTAAVRRKRASASGPRPEKSHRAAEGDVAQKAAKGLSRISRASSGSQGRGTFRYSSTQATCAPRRASSSGSSAAASSPRGRRTRHPGISSGRSARRPRTEPEPTKSGRTPKRASVLAVAGPTAPTRPRATAVRKSEASR